ncbi:hypothetical protein J5Y04_13225 [Kitasatospora sp. RG8]|uniref:hypothetical protein n=1 Tax=Kitasatospora sp. RG8 TaxID=2820815 RepID=UPI001ADF9072|nr:hypothetical protein [Kitasatospora sp. RG8]MBP0450505.1 hypothetical protein [Kitasatospora sp. RG8]
MSGRYLVMPDQRQGASWEFTPEQLDQALRRNWPDARMAGPAPRFAVYTLDVPFRGDMHELTYFADQQFFSFTDRDPLGFPFRVVFTLLLDLAPATPALWTNDFGGDVHSVDPLALFTRTGSGSLSVEG